MAKIAAGARDEFNAKSEPYKEEIEKTLKREKEILSSITPDASDTGERRVILAEEMIYIATIYLTINSLSEELLAVKNTDALNESRKTLYKAVIYLEEIVTNIIDAPYSDYEEALTAIENINIEKRFFIVRKLGLAIRMLIDAYGENTKWKWAFVELNGRFAVVAKNMLEIKEASRVFFDPSAPNYDVTVYYIQLVRKLIAQSADQYHQRYEFSTHRMDDMQKALLYIAAQRRFCIIFDEKDEAEELKKKGRVLKEKMELDHKKGIAQ